MIIVFLSNIFKPCYLKITAMKSRTIFFIALIHFLIFNEHAYSQSYFKRASSGIEEIPRHEKEGVVGEKSSKQDRPKKLDHVEIQKELALLPKSDQMDMSSFRGMGIQSVAEGDSLALVKLYQDWNGNRWKNKDGWLSSPVSEWYGVVVENERVVRLELEDNNMNGDVPEEIGVLTELTHLRLAGNYLYNILAFNDQQIFKPLTQLQVVSYTGYLGGLYNFEDATQLRELYLIDAQIDGDYFSYDTESSLDFIGNYFLQLERLHLVNNNLFQVMPESLGNLQLLTHLRITRATLNRFDYSNNDTDFPDSFVNLEQLQELEMVNCSLERIPDLRVLPALVAIDFRENRIPFLYIQPNVSTTFNTVLFHPQRKFPLTNTFHSLRVMEIEEEVFIETNIPGATIFRLFKDGSDIDASTGGSFFVGNADPDLEGQYFIRATNTALPDIVLETERVNLEYINFEFDPDEEAALEALFNALDGENWEQNFGWLQEPLLLDAMWQWHGLVTKNGKVREIYLHSNKLKGELPVELEAFSKLERLDLSENQISGTLPENMGSMIALNSLHLYHNSLEGDLPASMANLVNLRDINLRRNNFTGAIPAGLGSAKGLVNFDISENDFTELPELVFDINDDFFYPFNVRVANNRLNFSSLIRLSEIAELFPNPSDITFSFRQKKLDSSSSFSTDATSIVLSAPFDGAGTTVDWFKNGRLYESGSTGDLILAGDNISGFYQAVASNPQMSKLKLSSGFKVVRNTRLEATSLVVDNRPDRPADFRSIEDAVQASIARDTIYVMGSDLPYQGFSLTTPKVIYGPGYFLEINPDTQLEKKEAVVSGESYVIDWKSSDFAGSGSEIYGLVLDSLTIQANYRNPAVLDVSDFSDSSFDYDYETFISENEERATDTLKNVSIMRNKIGHLQLWGNNSQLALHQNFIDDLFMIGSYIDPFDETGEYQDENYSTLVNFSAQNNIIRNLGNLIDALEGNEGVDTYYAYEQENNLFGENSIEQNVIFRYGMQADFFFQNNMFERFDISSELFEGNYVGTFEEFFEDNSGSLIHDRDFQLREGSPAIGAGTAGIDQGAFGGDRPYVLSGLPPVPAVIDARVMENGDLQVRARQNASSGLINRIQYEVYVDDALENQGEIVVDEPDTNVEVTITSTMLGVVVEDQDMVIRLKAFDDNQVASHQASFAATFRLQSFNVSGEVVRIGSEEGITNFRLVLIQIDTVLSTYDTVQSIQNTSANTFSLENVLPGLYLLGVSPDEEEYPRALSAYYKEALFWDEADTLLVLGDTAGVLIEVTFLAEPASGDREILGVFEEELSINSRLIERTRVANARVTVRRSTSTSKGLDEDFVIVAETFTDANGQFRFDDLIPALYRIRFDYPGAPMDEARNIDIDLRENQRTEVVATIIDGRIVVEEKITLAASPFEKEITIFPNPTSDRLSIRMDKKWGACEFELIDLQGRRLLNGILHDEGEYASASLELSQFKEGLYLIQLRHTSTDQKGIVKVLLKK